MSRNKTPIASICGILFALGSVLFAMHFMTGYNTEPSTATIVAREEWEKTDSLGNVSKYTMVKVRFLTHSGDTVTGYKEPHREANAVGDQYDIIYKRDDPTEFYRPHSFLWYFVYFAVFALGIFLIYVSLKFENWRG